MSARLAVLIKTSFVLALSLHLHHRFHGPGIDYGAVAIASVASWLGVPGPGEPILIAAGIIAAHGKLDITTVIAVAFLSAMAGGIAGWLVGLKFGRKVLTTRGPLFRMRTNALRRGEEVFERYAVLAIVLTPSWIAGIHRVRTSTYLITNAVTALIWAAGIGLGAYYIGPPIIDAVSDLGTIAAIGVVLLILVGGWMEIRRRRRKNAQPAAPAQGSSHSAAAPTEASER